MAALAQHSATINRVARAALEPMGFQQRGRSRFWYDDHGWRAFFVDFQPSSWSKGTYCNVGVMFLWNPREVSPGQHWVFDESQRVTVGWEFASHDKNSTGFEGSVAALIAGAVTEILRFRSRFSTVASVAQHDQSQWPGVWADYHRSVAFGLTGSTEEAKAGLRRVTAVAAAAIALRDNQSDARLVRNADSLSRLADEDRAFKAAIEDQIAQCRESLGLQALPPPVVKLS